LLFWICIQRIPSEIAVKINPFDKTTFSSELMKLNEDSEKRKKITEKGKEFVRTFNWNKITDQYKDLIESK
jgi:glycosyltransferase involved in cell wall biosynthesis